MGNPAPARRPWRLALLTLLAIAASATAQPAANTPRPRDVLNGGIEQYKRGDFEAAANFFAQAEVMHKELSPTERRDLASYGKQNALALRQRQEGNAMLGRADEALRSGRMQEAANLLK